MKIHSATMTLEGYESVDLDNSVSGGVPVLRLGYISVYFDNPDQLQLLYETVASKLEEVLGNYKMYDKVRED